MKIESLKEQEKKLLDERSQPLRQYLADMVVPILTSGIIQICKERPDDPVDFLVDNFCWFKFLIISRLSICSRGAWT